MQVTVAQPQPPAPDQAPGQTAPAPAGTPTGILVPNPDGTNRFLPLPTTQAEVAAIRSRRDELSNQLINVSERRSELAAEMARQPAGPARDGMQERLAVLDSRLAQMESDLAATGRQLTEAALVNPTEGPVNGDMPENVLALSIVFTLFVIFPLAITLARNLWKRGNRQMTTQQISPETNQRLERLEQGVEAIAIEIERVSEGQRFVTKLLAEGTGPARIQQSETVAERV
jgi:hypothetical protein